MNSVLKRFGRVALAGAIGGVITVMSGEPYWLVAGPIINAIGKAIRQKYGWTWLPF